MILFPLQTSYHATVPENSPQGTSVIEVQATDSDAGDFGVIRYSLIGERSLDFTIDQKVKTYILLCRHVQKVYLPTFRI